jgi:Protein of unknown function (DUF3455)
LIKVQAAHLKEILIVGFSQQICLFRVGQANKNHRGCFETPAKRATLLRPCFFYKGINSMNALQALGFSVAFLISPLPIARAEVPEAIAARDERLVATVHAEGAQVYECKSDASGELAWQFREPIATLLVDGKTIGRHFAGPSWELADGSAVSGKVAGRADGATSKDIPLLKLEVTSRRGTGQLADSTTIQRLNTVGGVAEGRCNSAGAFLNVPYSADYAFYSKGG